MLWVIVPVKVMASPYKFVKEFPCDIYTSEPGLPSVPNNTFLKNRRIASMVFRVYF